MTQQKYPIGIQTFAKIREEGFTYVDKTEDLHNLITRGGKYYFLSRPRRFGKSLLLSTIESFYRGRQDLFDGLAISRYEHDWQSYPVFHISMSRTSVTCSKDLENILSSFLAEYKREYGNDETTDSIAIQFGGLIKKAHEVTGRKVVILVDEYDKPLLDAADNPLLQEQLRTILRGFYSNLKNMDSHIEFVMLTGVTKFGKLSIFSDLNNLRDISLSRQYSSICGITTEELHRYFHQGIIQLSEELGITAEQAYEELRNRYDGYHFAPGAPDIYNPFSILNALADLTLRDYWFETGTPTFLLKMIKDERTDLRILGNYVTDLQSINSISFSADDTIPILYQSGYLSIKSYNREHDTVTLDYPNQEVERGFVRQLFNLYTTVNNADTAFTVKSFIDDIENGNTEGFMNRLKSLFAGYQYDHIDLGNLELHYQNVIYLLMKLMGYRTRAEMRTSNGRIDLLVETRQYVYLFEFKVDATAREALNQINDRGYAISFRADNRQIIKIGVNFSSRQRNIESYIIDQQQYT